MQPINKESKPSKPRFARPNKESNQLHQPLKKSHREWRKIQERKDTTKLCHQRKCQLLVTISIEEVVLAEPIGLARKEEVMEVLETCMMSKTNKSISKKDKKMLLRNKQNKRSLNNHKESHSMSTTKTRESILPKSPPIRNNL